MVERANKTNPYDYQQEVIDPALFAGREAELVMVKEEVIDPIGNSSSCPRIALVGERRVGKSSFLVRFKSTAAQNNVLPVLFALNKATANDPWEFWRQVIDSILDEASSAGIKSIVPARPFGFNLPVSDKRSEDPQVHSGLHFGEFYLNRGALGEAPPEQIIRDDFLFLIGCVVQAGFHGLILLI